MSAADRATAPPAQRAPYGYFDGVVGGLATGWCWREDDPSLRLEVELLVDGAVVGTATAQGRRQNVERAGYGDGRYGFRIPLPDSLADGGTHRVQVRADGVELPAAREFIGGGPAAGSNQPPPGPARWAQTVFEPDDRVQSSPAEPDGRAPYGYFDGVVGGLATGWCWREDDPSLRLEVELLVDGAVVGTATAQGRRQNVERAGYGDGRYGFRIQLPEAMDDRGAHRVAVRAQGAALPAAREFMRGGPARGSGGAPADARDLWATTVFEPGGITAQPAPAAEPEPESESAEIAAPARGLRRLGRRPRPPEAPEMAGYIDGLNHGELFGWVVDVTRPGDVIEVEAFFDREPIGRGAADVPREDVERAGYGARHGFSFPLPDLPGPGRHTVEVRTADGSAVALAGDHIVVDAAGEPIDAVKLVAASGAVTPPALARPTAALLGLDGWLFEWLGPDAFGRMRGAERIEDDLLELQLFGLAQRHEMARTAGVSLLQAVIPDKLAVYRDRLPAGVLVVDAARPVERLAAAVAERNALDCLDLTAPLRQARPHGDVFARTARGLSWLGAFAAYRAIAKALALSRPGVIPVERSALTFTELEPVADSLGDLPRLVWIGDGPLPAGIAADDEEHEGQPRLDWSALATEYAVLAPELAALAGSAGALLRRRRPGDGADAVVVHDGSATRIAPFLAEHFERTLLLGPGADLDGVLEELAPAVMIEIVAESTLLQE